MALKSRYIYKYLAGRGGIDLPHCCYTNGVFLNRRPHQRSNCSIIVFLESRTLLLQRGVFKFSLYLHDSLLCALAVKRQTNASNKHLLGAVTDDIVGEDIVAAAHREPDSVPVVLEPVPTYFCSEGLEQSHTGVTVVVAVVIWGFITFYRRRRGTYDDKASGTAESVSICKTKRDIV